MQLTAFIFGIVIGFTGPNLELFKSDRTPLKDGKITPEEESWISSLSAFGAIGFVLIYGWISERFGRKIAILLIGIPQTVIYNSLKLIYLFVYARGKTALQKNAGNVKKLENPKMQKTQLLKNLEIAEKFRIQRKNSDIFFP